MVRREDIFWGEGGGVDWSCERVFSRAVVAIVVVDVDGLVRSSEMLEMLLLFGGCFEELDVAMVAVEHSALRKRNLAPRWARTVAIHDMNLEYEIEYQYIERG